MTKLRFSHIAVAATSMVVAACHSSRSVASEEAGSVPELSQPVAAAPIGGGNLTGSVNALPKATVYQTNVDCAQNVAITIDPSTGQITYYPDPSDITPDSAPLQLDNGWLLARQGSAGTGTRFLRYTYTEYAALPKVPAIEELKAAIIPDARVTISQKLDITLAEALADPDAITIPSVPLPPSRRR